MQSVLDGEADVFLGARGHAQVHHVGGTGIQDGLEPVPAAQRRNEFHVGGGAYGLDGLGSHSS